MKRLFKRRRKRVWFAALALLAGFAAADLARESRVSDAEWTSPALSTVLLDAKGQPLRVRLTAEALDARPEEALRLAHSLKGAARNVGGLMLGEVAAALETALREERRDRVGACLPRLRWELAQLEAAWTAAPV